jgi:hypothetical protein
MSLHLNKDIILKLAKELHLVLFSEEYDYILDSSVDYESRKKNINPMGIDYINSVNAKRIDLGVDLLSENGMAISSQSLKFCVDVLEKLVIGINCKLREKVEKYLDKEGKEKFSFILTSLGL